MTSQAGVGKALSMVCAVPKGGPEVGLPPVPESLGRASYKR